MYREIYNKISVVILWLECLDSPVENLNSYTPAPAYTHTPANLKAFSIGKALV